MTSNSRPLSSFKILTNEEVSERLDRREPVYILFWCGMSDIDERALKYQKDAKGAIRVWCNSGNDQPFELDFKQSKIAFEGIYLNRYELTAEEFLHFSKLKISSD